MARSQTDAELVARWFRVTAELHRRGMKLWHAGDLAEILVATAIGGHTSAKQRPSVGWLRPETFAASEDGSTLGDMRNRWLVVVSAAVAMIVVGAAVIGGYVGEPEPPAIVVKKGVPYYESGGFNWELAALALAGLGTLALALATGTLAASTWQDVRASQRIAEASVEANRLVRSEQERRPQLTLSWDPEKRESIPAETRVWVRLRVHNAPGLRAAQGTRVLVDRCVHPDGESITFGSPALRWMGAKVQDADEPVVVFAGAWRVITLGSLVHMRPQWRLKLGLDNGGSFGAGTTFRLIVGSDEADARFYDVIVGWREDAGNVQDALTSLAVRADEVPTASAHQ